jgi:membrane-bound serine protease (ClpP class)
MLRFLAQAASETVEAGGWGSSPILAAALFLLGFIFIVAEIFTITFGFFTLCAVASFVFGLAVAYQAGLPWLIGFSVVAVAGIPTFIAVMLKVMPRTRFGRRLIPDGPKAEDVTATGTDATLLKLLGKEGRTLGMLRPSGIAEFDGKRYDVIAEGLPINAGRPVKVVVVEGNRVIVRELE